MVRSDTERSSARARAVVTPRRRSRCTIRKRRSARRTAAILRLAGLEDAHRGARRIAQDAEDAVRDLDALAHDLRSEIARPPRTLGAVVDADVGEPSRDALEQLLGEP